jgi:hypothetical protein
MYEQAFIHEPGPGARRLIVAALAAASLIPAAANALSVRVTIENHAPPNGVFITPVWVGFHDGTFDIYDMGSPAASFLERIAEDGATGPISAAFGASAAGSAQGTLLGPVIPPIAPGESTTMVFDLDPNATTSRYFSYASMIIPSNDAFIANGNPLQFRIFADNGDFLGANFVVTGERVLDAGTEVNDEIPAHTAFFGQSMPDTGVDENGVVGLHPGFLPVGAGGILADPDFANADFTLDGYTIAEFRITAVPVPPALWLLGSALGAFGLVRRSPRPA